MGFDFGRVRVHADAGMRLLRKPGATALPGDQLSSSYYAKRRDPEVSGFIYFPTLEAKLDETDKEVIGAIVAEAAELAVLNEVDFAIDGRADIRPVAGDPKGNQTLAAHRAAVTDAALREQISLLPDNLAKKALTRGRNTVRHSTAPEPFHTLDFQRRAEIRISVKPTLEKQQLIEWDPSMPEYVTIKGIGVTPRRLAIELYGDDTHTTSLWFQWEESQDGKLTWETVIPAGRRARIAYSHLRPLKQRLYDRTVTIAPRDTWGARPAITNDPKRLYEGYTGKLEDILDSIVIHHSGNSNMHTMKEVQDHHIDKKEAADINYHYGIDLQGKVHEGRPINIKGSHVKGANTGKIGVVLLADLDEGTFDTDDDLTVSMETSLLRFIHYLIGRYPNIKYLGGHLEFASAQGDDRTCPGNLTMAKMSSWRSSTALVKP